MKKIYMAAAMIVALALLLVGCAARPDSGGMNDSGTQYMPDVGSSESGGAPNYQYGSVVENNFAGADETNSGYFTLDRNTASYSIMRREINNGLTVMPDSVRLEEYVNYFNYDYARPDAGNALAIGGSIFPCPWNDQHMLMQVGIAAEQLDMSNRAPGNFVFLIDTSGSMYGADRLGLIQQSFVMLLDSLSDDDVVSVVTYAQDAGVRIEGKHVKTDKRAIAAVIEDLVADGSTNGSGGIEAAYAVAEKYYVEGGINRVIIATDGDFNVGLSNQSELKDFIYDKANLPSKPITLSVLGVGMFNTNDATMETLARNGNGNHYYLDSVEEARKVLVEEFGGTMRVVAKDAKAGVTFNSSVVDRYRLLGYDTKIISKDEFDNIATDAGEIGSGHTVTVLYEVDFKDDFDIFGSEAEIATVEVRYKSPDASAEDDSLSVSRTFTSLDAVRTPSEQNTFIACVAEYALLLRESQYKGQASFDSVCERLQSIADYLDGDVFRSDFYQLVIKAKELYSHN